MDDTLIDTICNDAENNRVMSELASSKCDLGLMRVAKGIKQF